MLQNYKDLYKPNKTKRQDILYLSQTAQHRHENVATSDNVNPWLESFRNVKTINSWMQLPAFIQ